MDSKLSEKDHIIINIDIENGTEEDTNQYIVTNKDKMQRLFALVSCVIFQYYLYYGLEKLTILILEIISYTCYIV